MTDSFLLPDLIQRSAERDPAATALTYGSGSMTYGALSDAVDAFSSVPSASASLTTRR